MAARLRLLMATLLLALFAGCVRTPIAVQSSNVPVDAHDYTLSPEVLEVEDTVFYLLFYFPFGDGDQLSNAVRKLEQMSPSGRVASITVDRQVMFILIGNLVDVKVTARPLIARQDKEQK